MNKDPGYYPSKLLIFGEYGVLLGLKAFAVPFFRFWGQIGFSPEKIEPMIHNFFRHLKSINRKLPIKIHVDELEKVIMEGLFFASNIPRNYGLGSSGALTAAIFDQYRVDNSAIENYEPSLLKEEFSIIESYFHGKSSGIDPLVSFTQRGIFTEGLKVETTNVAPLSKENAGFFLYDSKIEGKTSGNVNSFLKKLEDRAFHKSFFSAYKEYSDMAIDYILKGDFERLKMSMEGLSRFQFENMEELIPEKIKKVFALGLQTGNYFLKLCGSGGGGYFLGFTHNLKDIEYNIGSKVLIL